MGINAILTEIRDGQAKLQTQQAVMCNDMKHLIKDNVEFKESMNKNVATLKTDYYKTKTIVQKHTIWFAILHFFTVSLLAYIGLKT